MIEAGICEDDLVVVRAQAHAEAGEIVVALVDGESTVKRLERRNSKLWLQPADPATSPSPSTATRASSAKSSASSAVTSANSE